MAKVKAKTAFNVDNFAVLNDNPSVVDDGFIRIVSGALTGEYSGAFQVNGLRDFSGTLNKYELFEIGILQASVTQINRDAQRFVDVLDLGNTVALQNFILNGADKFILSSFDDKAQGRAGDDLLKGKGGNDKLKGDGGDDRVFGNAGNDKVTGNAGNDVVKGGSGDDKAFGGGGDDRVLGNSGNDKVKGNSGADTLIGGTGDDTLTGGGGADVFIFGKNDGDNIIRDFEIGIDDIELRQDGSFGTFTRTEDSGDTLLTFNETTIRLIDIDPQDINVVDFLD